MEINTLVLKMVKNKRTIQFEMESKNPDHCIRLLQKKLRPRARVFPKRAIQLENDRKIVNLENSSYVKNEQQEQRYAQEREQQRTFGIFKTLKNKKNSREMSLKSQKMTITTTTRSLERSI